MTSKPTHRDHDEQPGDLTESAAGVGDPMEVDRVWRALTARYPGRCHAGCGQSIEPGDDIRMTDDGAVHAGCTPRPEADPLAAEHPVCTDCWLTHPLGACDR